MSLRQRVGLAAAGLIFALGLGISEMTRPEKILSFLTLQAGWDPSLVLVMAGAIFVYAPAYWWRRRHVAPVQALEAPLPGQIDGRLLVGAALFGVGWGLVGFCPGPALVAAGSGAWPVLLFVAAMVLSTAAYQLLQRRLRAPRKRF